MATTSTTELVARFFDALERKDEGTVASLLAPDTVLTLPLSFDGGQDPALALRGRDAVLGYWTGAFARFSTIRLLGRRITPSEDGRVAFVEGRGDFEAEPGRSYRNVYVWRVEVGADGAIRSVDGYANPVAFAAAFGPPPAP